MAQFVMESVVEAPVAQVWAWHTRDGVLQRLMPPFEPTEVLGEFQGVVEGAEVQFRMRFGPVPITWSSKIVESVAESHFVDVQTSGPFASWRHTHRFDSVPEGTKMTDIIDYELPLGSAGDLVAGRAIAAKLQATFAYRHRRVQHSLRMLAQSTKTLTVAITGASGLVGTRLAEFLEGGGHRVVRIGRKARQPEDCVWDLQAGTIEADKLEGVDAIVHLAGASISKSWTPNHKQAIRESRTLGTALIAKTAAELPTPPAVLLSCSAVGFYGNTTEPVDESAPAGEDFLAEVAVAWEQAAEPARKAGIRVVHPRVGIVQSARGAMLAELLGPFRMGGGGPVGSGQQGVSWIHLDDLVYGLWSLILDADVDGPVNMTAPTPVSQREYARTLGRALGRPAITPLPAFVVRSMFGEMGDAVLLGGQFVTPSKLTGTGYQFAYPELSQAFAAELG